MAQPLCDVERSTDCFPEPIWEKADKRDLSNADPIDSMGMLISVVRRVPINQKPAPDHNAEDRKIDPMHPPDRKWMFTVETKRQKLS